MPRSEKIGYLIAVLILVVGGAFLRSIILNWICGPAIVVGSVILSTRLFEKFDKPLETSEEQPV
jgi:hypothetical protein